MNVKLLVELAREAARFVDGIQLIRTEYGNFEGEPSKHYVVARYGGFQRWIPVNDSDLDLPSDDIRFYLVKAFEMVKDQASIEADAR